MLDTMNEDDPIVFVYPVDDPVVASPRRPEADEAAGQLLAQTVRVLGDRSEDGRQRRFSYLVRQSVEMPQPFGRYFNLVQVTSHMVEEPEPPTLGSLLQRPLQRLHQLVITHDVKGLLQRFLVNRGIRLRFGHGRRAGHPPDYHRPHRPSQVA